MPLIKTRKITNNEFALWYLLSLSSGRADSFFIPGHDIEFAINWAKGLPFIQGAFRKSDLIGIGYADNVLSYPVDGKIVRRADVGFSFLKNCNVFEALAGGRELLSNCFNELNLDHVFGSTSEGNKPALAYCKRIGMKAHGPVPNFSWYDGKLTGSYTLTISREEWNKLQNKLD